ncbi:uncharacterized protein LOC142574730 [Dermacentor variabilis]|uniref:uncharacterized protein LOC142574730 n=1 Tax=Dermacentor variabilis TaxID=34621 RepID=UPI003F5ADE96
MASSSPEQHPDRLRLLFARLQEHGLTLNTAKCVFGVNNIEFLGHLVTPEGVQPLDGKVEALCDFPHPTSLRKLREFLGLLNFHRRLDCTVARIVLPLTDMLKPSKAPSAPLEWTSSADAAFEEAKNSLANATELVHPLPNVPMRLITDASSNAVTFTSALCTSAFVAC